MKKCYIYTRVSTATQTEGYSLEAQDKRLRDYADFKELVIVGAYCDAGCSGHSIKGRPQFSQMMDDIVSLKDDISFVLVFKLSRFGRNAADVLKSMQLLSDYGIDLVSVEDSIDSSTQGGRLTLSILSAVAEIERENISVQFLSGRMQRIKEGRWPGGPAPFGYRIKDKQLVTEPAEAEIVKLIYETYLQDGMMANTAATHLNESGIHITANGQEKPVSRDMVVRILDNPVYAGWICLNRRAADKRKEILKVEGIHEPVVSKEMWEAAQKKRQENYRERRKVDNPERISLLSGLVKCPVCGAGMVCIKNKKQNTNHGGIYKILYHYACTNHRSCNGRSCGFSTTYNQEKLDGAVMEAVGRLKMSAEFKAAVKDQLGSRDRTAEIEETMKGLRKEIRGFEVRTHKFGESLDHLDILDEDYDRQYEELQSQIDAVYDSIEEAEEELQRWERRLSASKQGIRSGAQVMKILENWDRVYERMDSFERRELCRSFIERIDVFPEYADGRMLKGIAFRFPVGTDDLSWYLDCSKAELTAAEARAKGTYAQIKAYILDKYGAKVPHLYIAQMKRKYGLEMGKNYNLPKNENAHVPQCPKAKEEMILDALKHYKMVPADTQIIEEGEKRGGS